MNTITADFDTHQFFKDMTGEGMSEGQAEKLAAYLKQHHSGAVTKEYLKEYLDMRLSQLETRLETRLTLRILWICGGMSGVTIAAVGMMMQFMVKAVTG